MEKLHPYPEASYMYHDEIMVLAKITSDSWF